MFENAQELIWDNVDGLEEMSEEFSPYSDDDSEDFSDSETNEE